MTSNVSPKIKYLVLYALVAIIPIAGTGLLPWIDVNNLIFYYYIAQILSLVLGIAHVFLIRAIFPEVVSENFGNGFWMTIVIMILSAIAAAVLYYIIKLPYNFITYIIPFIIPYLAWQAFNYFAAIPPRIYKLWYYPVSEDIPDLDFIDLNQVEMVQFLLKKSPKNAAKSNFTSKAPLNMTLGQLFFILINDYNEKNPQSTVTYLTPEQKPYGWWFYKKKGLFKSKHFLDPGLTFQENGIIANDSIYAVRYAKIS